MLAARLQADLQRFAKPWHKMRAVRVFLDTASLGTDPGLWASIEAALGSSRWFILLASPGAARSAWVDREVRWWLEHRTADRLLVVGTEPGLAWDHDREDWAAGAPVPPALRCAFASEPLWLDLSDTRPDGHRAWIPADRVAAVAAPLRGMQKDALVGEHVREHRRALRLAAVAVAVMTVLTVLSVVASLVAIGQRDAAIRQRDNAASDALINESQALAGTDPAMSRLLSVAAWRLHPSSDARYAMLAAATQPQIAVLGSQGDPVYSVTFSPDGRTLASTSTNARLWDVATGRPIGGPLKVSDGPVGSLVFSPDGKVLASAGSDGRDGIIRLWDVATGRLIGSPSKVPGPVLPVAFSPDGKTLASAGYDGTVRLWDVARRRLAGSHGD